MAYISTEYCRKCETETNHINRKCFNCSAREERERIALWNAKTTDEKLQDLRIRMEKMERGEIRYG
jgi:hypothetical protein